MASESGVLGLLAFGLAEQLVEPLEELEAAAEEPELLAALREGDEGPEAVEQEVVVAVVEADKIQKIQRDGVQLEDVVGCSEGRQEQRCLVLVL